MKLTITVAQVQLVHDEGERPSPADVRDALTNSNVNAFVGKVTLAPAARRDTVRPSWPPGTQPQPPSAAALAGQDPPPRRERTHRDTGLADRVMRFLRDAGRPVARGEVTREVDMTQREFTATIGHLRDEGEVVQSGSHGGTRYSAAPPPPGVSSARPGQRAIEGTTLRGDLDRDEQAALDAFRELAYPDLPAVAKHLDRKPADIRPVVDRLTGRGFLRRHSDGTYSPTG